jgi:hypothetical protein
MDNNDLFSNLQDPFQRLEEMEEGLLNHAHHIERMAGQTKEHALMFVEISDSIKQLVDAVNQIQHQQLYIYKIIKEKDESSK